MQYSIATIAALAATVSASASYGYSNGTVVYTTEVHTAYTTVCPYSTTLEFNGVTYTATESETLTITNCPCTVVKPVTTTSVVAPTTSAAPPPVYTSAPVYTNATTVVAPSTPVGTVGSTAIPSPSASTTPIEASNGNKAFALSGASLAGLLGLAAYIL